MVSPRLRSSGRSVFWLSRISAKEAKPAMSPDRQAADWRGSPASSAASVAGLGEALVADEDLGF